MPDNTLAWYADDGADDLDTSFALSWKLRRGGPAKDDLGSAEFRTSDQRWWGLDYTKSGADPTNCATFGPFEQLAEAQAAVETSVGDRALASRFGSV